MKLLNFKISYLYLEEVTLITIKFFSTLKRYSDNKDTIELDLGKVKNIKDILDLFSFIPGELGVILLNSELASEDSIIKDGDVIELFPIFGGG